MDNDTQEVENGFLNLLREMRHGELEAELDEELRKLAAMCAVRGGNGKIQVTISVTALKEFENAYAVLDEIKVTHPKPKRSAEVRFRDRTGSLVSDRPDQSSIFDTPPEQTEPINPGNVSPINK